MWVKQRSTGTKKGRSHTGRVINRVVLISLAISIKTLSFFPVTVEKYYSTGLYPLLSKFLRLLFGWCPFSLGDIGYGIVLVWLLVRIARFWISVIRGRADRDYWLGALRRAAFFCLLVYTLFYGLWGLNYDRVGIANQLSLKVHPYSTDELQQVLNVIVARLNEADSSGRAGRPALNSRRYLFDGAVSAYDRLAVTDPAFAYSRPSVKPSLFAWLGNYAGFGGYYNPFSGEAQVNTTMPVFTQPFTVCHEMGHQLGYAKENEANFSGYLSAKSAGIPAFSYSVYLDMYTYAARELYVRDSNLLKPFRARLNPGIRKDFTELKAFYNKYKNPFEPVIRKVYGRYLKANSQPQGIMSYNEVIAWLIAYYQRYGAAAL